MPASLGLGLVLFCFEIVSCSPGWPQAYFVAEVELGLLIILLPQSLKC